MERERCPKCANKGLDTSGDNLAVYPDGHKHCYACGYHQGVPLEERIRQVQYGKPSVSNVDQTFDFPNDYTTDLPINALTWLRKYGIVNEEIIKHRFGWSQERQMLIFPVLDGDGNLIMWQGRNFDANTPLKYFTKGPASDILHLVGNPCHPDNTVVLTEDLISAIKVGRLYQAMPIWGSHIPLKTTRRLSERFKTLGVWLDRDKMDEALRAVLRASQYMPAYLITSVFDPKEYTVPVIRETVEAAMLDKVTEGEEGTDSSKTISHTCRRLCYAEAAKKYPQYIRNLTDYIKFRNSFDNVSTHEVVGPEPKDFHKPHKGETYDEWRDRLFIPDDEKAQEMYRRKKTA